MLTERRLKNLLEKAKYQDVISIKSEDFYALGDAFLDACEVLKYYAHTDIYQVKQEYDYGDTLDQYHEVSPEYAHDFINIELDGFFE